jgi:archaellum component FlaG (FlaF/FlaG flagellin family)
MKKLIFIIFVLLISCSINTMDINTKKRLDSFIGKNIEDAIPLFGNKYSIIKPINPENKKSTNITYDFYIYNFTARRDLCINSTNFGSFCVDTSQNRHLIFKTTNAGIILSWSAHN